MPTPAATNPPILLAATYDMARAVFPSLSMATTSTENVLNVVKLQMPGLDERNTRHYKTETGDGGGSSSRNRGACFETCQILHSRQCLAELTFHRSWRCSEVRSTRRAREEAGGESTVTMMECLQEAMLDNYSSIVTGRSVHQMYRTYPTPIMSLALGERPRRASPHGLLPPNNRCWRLASAGAAPLILATSTVGAAEIPPNRKLPATLIPAVCHRLHLPNRAGSVAMTSAATFPT
jgi:hypothetical protein